MDLYNKLKEISELFRIEGTYVGYETIQVGNVNKTYEVKFILPDGRPKSYLIQNVNTYAFRRPVELMENIDKVTEHIRAKRPGRVALHFHHTADRKTYVIDGENFWRMTNYIPSRTYNTVESMDIIRNAGMAFGEFQTQLADFDIHQLYETIPGFHNTRQRYEKLIASAEADPAGRVAEVREELNWLLEVRDLACSLTDLHFCFDTTNVADMTRMFCGCSFLETISLRSFSTSNTVDMCCMFFGCNDLVEADISSFDFSSVRITDSMFAHCESLENIGVSELNLPETVDATHMFSGCCKLNVKVPGKQVD